MKVAPGRSRVAGKQTTTLHATTHHALIHGCRLLPPTRLRAHVRPAAFDGWRVAGGGRQKNPPSTTYHPPPVLPSPFPVRTRHIDGRFGLCL
jgi:hypothetical protein